ncbi:hypothetical protein Tco_1556056 [Tanacetum coccineum]
MRHLHPAPVQVRLLLLCPTSNSFGDCVDDYDDDEVHLPDDTRKKRRLNLRRVAFGQDTEAADLAQVVKEVEHGNG